MKVSILYNYQCTCGYSYSKTDETNAVGAYIRPVIDSLVSCPQCHRLLPVEITLSYATTALVVIEGQTRHEERLNALAEIAHIAEDTGLYD